MRHAPQPARPGTRFTRIAPVPGIGPVDGWSLFSTLDQDGDGFACCDYIARGPDHDVYVPVSRFLSAFHPTQERFAFLVSIGFAQKPCIHATGPWDNHDIDAAIAAGHRAVAA